MKSEDDQMAVTLTVGELKALVAQAVRDAADTAREPPSEWLDAASAAALLGINRRTLLKRAAAGDVHGSRIGRLWRFRRVDIERLLVAP